MVVLCDLIPIDLIKNKPSVKDNLDSHANGEGYPETLNVEGKLKAEQKCCADHDHKRSHRDPDSFSLNAKRANYALYCPLDAIRSECCNYVDHGTDCLLADFFIVRKDVHNLLTENKHKSLNRHDYTYRQNHNHF